MEQRAFALEPGSLGGGAISEKSLVSMSDVMSSLELLTLDTLDTLCDNGSDRGSGSFWYSCLDPEWGRSIAAAVLDEGSSSA